jgi:hypothetical protein
MVPENEGSRTETNVGEGGKEMSSEKLTGPKKAKLAIDDFEAWLVDRCREKQEKDKIVAEYQFQTGHSIRKLNEWIDAIHSNGNIKFVRDSGKDYLVSKCSTGEKEEPKHQVKLSKKAQDFFEKCERREEMMLGPCKDECSAPIDKDCSYCNVYLSLHRMLPLSGERYKPISWREVNDSG